MYPTPAFLLKRQSGLTMKIIWRLHVGVCSFTSFASDLLIYFTSNSFNFFKGPCKSCRRVFIWKGRKRYDRVITRPSYDGTSFFRFQQHNKPRKEEERDISVEKMIFRFFFHFIGYLSPDPFIFCPPELFRI